MEEENKTSGDENTTAQEAVAQQDAAGSGEPSEKTNPNAEDFKGMRNSMKEMKGENAALRGEIAQLRQALTAPPPKAKDPFDGRDGSDYLTIDEQRQREQALLNKFNQGKQQLEQQTLVMSFLSSHPDYEETMNKYGKSLPSQLRRFLARNPQDPEAMQAAYAACKDSSAYYRDHLSDAQHDNVKRAQENMSKPGAGSSSGSGGTVSLVNKLKNMTKEERIAYSNRCIQEGGG